MFDVGTFKEAPSRGTIWSKSTGFGTNGPVSHSELTVQSLAVQF